MMVRDGGFAMIVVDSVAALIPQVEIEKDMGDSVMGVHARLMSQAMRKLTAPTSKSNTALVFVNQTRSKIGVAWGNPEVTTGGVALKFYASLRIKIAYTGKVKEGDQQVASKGKITVVKNKLATPFKEAEFTIGEYGIDGNVALIKDLVDKGILVKSGSFYKHNDEVIAQGAKALMNVLREDPGLKDRLVQSIHK
jgi:recombination protein RecA